jgi:hypothetical protein
MRKCIAPRATNLICFLYRTADVLTETEYVSNAAK